MIDEHLLNIIEIEYAGKVLLDFSKNPKKFTFCRYPLLLCCLVCEFSNKCKERFPIYESFFTQIYNSFSVSGQLFVDKIRKDSVLEYHLNQKDLRGRTCLQIMSQNRLYLMLEDSDVAAIIGKYWSGSTIQFGLISFSSFYHISKSNSHDDMYKLQNISKKINEHNSFFFNYYSYRDISSIRYYYKLIWNFIVVISLMLLIYLSVDKKSLSKTKDSTFWPVKNFAYYGIYTIILNKISSWIFFLFVDKWWKETDNNIFDIALLMVNFFHFSDSIKWFIKQDKTTDISKYDDLIEIYDSYSLSVIIFIMWYKVFNSFASFKILGGFIQTMILLVKKMFFIVLFFYCFILMCTGIFNMYFIEVNQFKTYLDSWFYLFQASLQQFDFDEDFTIALKFTISIYMIICTSIMINLIIAYSTNIYKTVDENVDAEYRASLVELHEYFKWHPEYGIFKFFHAPLNVLQLPFYFLVLVCDRKKYWNNIFCKILYSVVAVMYFIVLLILNILLMPYAYIKTVISYLLVGKLFSLLKFVVLAPLCMIVYYGIDVYNYWRYVYSKPYNSNLNEEEDIKQSIQNIKKLFSDLVVEISDRIKLEKKRKEIYLSDLVSGWLRNMSTIYSNNTVNDESNKIHKKTFLISKYKDDIEADNLIENKKSKVRQTHQNIMLNASQSTIFHNFKQILNFLGKFSNSDGKIDVELAKNIFPKKNFYDDEYFEFLYYFHFENFGSLLNNNTKENVEERKEMNKLRGVLTDLDKISKKFYNMKFLLRNLDFNDFELLEFCINNINVSFAVLEKHLLEAQSKEEIKKIMFNAGPKEDANFMNKIASELK